MAQELFAHIDGEPIRVSKQTARVVLAELSEDSDPRIGRDAGGRVRVSQITTLGDYKILNADRPHLMDVVGTGSGSYGNSKYTMSVQSGQYLIRYSKQFHPYFSGKSEVVEETWDNFQLQDGVVKRVGYFSSSSTGSYDTALDGYWLESNGVSGTYYLRAQRMGVDTVSVPWTEWDNYEKLSDYNWKNFTVCLTDFLWLGGAALNLSIKSGKIFVKAHSQEYAGTREDVFIQSPNQPIRYEIRGISGAGTLRFICAQVGTEGSVDEAGLSGSVDTGTSGITLANTGTVYPVKAIRKLSTRRDVPVSVEELDLMLSTVNDQVRWSLQINPTLSAPLTYTTLADSAVQHANGNGTITVTSSGRELVGGYLKTDTLMRTGTLKKNFLSYLTSRINNTMDEIVLCVSPVSGSVTVFGGIMFKEY